MKAILHTTPKPSDPIKQKTGEGCSGATCSPRELATKIAMRLFTNGFGDEGTRLDIRKSVEMVEHSIGGWCFKAVVDQIERAILEENTEASRDEGGAKS